MKQLLSILALAIAFVASSYTLDTAPGIGDVAPDFTLKNVDGNMVQLSGLKDVKGTIVIFTCNTCPYAKAYESRIIALHQKYAALGYLVVAINSNDPNVQPGDSYDKMQARAKEKSYPFAYLYDQSQEIAQAYGAIKTPHVYILDKDRKIQYIGAIDDNSEDADDVKEKYVENAVDALLGGKEVAVKQTKAIGCGIKWKKS
ncbi:MAG: thioredoxin family protein [Saprospiraceae bacterium]